MSNERQIKVQIERYNSTHTLYVCGSRSKSAASVRHKIRFVGSGCRSVTLCTWNSDIDVKKLSFLRAEKKRIKHNISINEFKIRCTRTNMVRISLARICWGLFGWVPLWVQRSYTDSKLVQHFVRFHDDYSLGTSASVWIYRMRLQYPGHNLGCL